LTPDDAWSKGEIRGRLRKPAIGEHGIGNVEAWLGPEALETFAAMGVSLVFDACCYANDD
jgi:hypothetical protein